MCVQVKKMLIGELKGDNSCVMKVYNVSFLYRKRMFYCHNHTDYFMCCTFDFFVIIMRNTISYKTY